MSSNAEKGKRLAQGTIIYAIGSFGSKILSFIIVPLYTYYILPEDMGVYDILQTTVSLLTPLITLQISDAAFVWMIQAKEDEESCISAVYKYMLFMSFVAAILILIFDAFLYNIPYNKYFIIMLLTSRWMATIQKLTRGLKKQSLFAMSGVIYTFVHLILNLLQIVVFKQGVVALFQSIIIANCFVIVFLLLKEKKLRYINWRQKSINLQKEMLKFSIPVVPNQLNWWVVNSSDRYIISYFLGSAVNGIYAIAYKFPTMLHLIFNLFYQSWQDTTLGDTEEDTSGFYTNVFRIYYKISFTLIIALIPLTKVFIEFVMNDSYKEAASYISFLYLGVVFQAFSNFWGVGYLKNGKTVQASLTTIVGAIINIIINVLCINFIGLHAATISSCISFIIVFIIRYHHTKELLNIQVDWYEFVVLFIVALLVTIFCIFTSISFDLIMGIFGCVCFGLFNKDYLLVVYKKLLLKMKKKSGR